MVASGSDQGGPVSKGLRAYIEELAALKDVAVEDEDEAAAEEIEDEIGALEILARNNDEGGK